MTSLAPTGLGGPVGLIWVSGTSMEPNLQTGDLVVVYEHDTYDVGDVVAFRIPGGGTVIHRVIDATADGYRFQGDNRDFADPWLLGRDDIIGAKAVTVPNAGSAMTVLGRPAIMAALVAALALLWCMRPGGAAGEHRGAASSDEEVAALPDTVDSGHDGLSTLDEDLRVSGVAHP